MHCSLHQRPTMRRLANLLPSFLVFACLNSQYGIATDTITFTGPIQDQQSIVSSGQTYRLGFFSPVGTANRYVGIIMNATELTVIWVANRDRPLKDSDGMVAISEDGNIVVLNGSRDVLWSSNVSSPAGKGNSSAQLLDSGNLILRGHSNGTTIWESFQFPTDHCVTEMRLGTTPQYKNQLTSWKSPSDPSVGSFTLSLDPLRLPEAFVLNDSRPYWRSGPWDGNVFIGVPGMTTAFRGGFHMMDDTSGSMYIVYAALNGSDVTYNVLNSSGTFVQMLSDGRASPRVLWSSIQSECDVYGKCGHFGLCNAKASPICSCPHGFEPSDKIEWRRGSWTGGCQRKALLQHERNNSAAQDGFLKLNNIKLPDFCYVVEFRDWHTEGECENMCLNNSTCDAYAFNRGIGCMHWSDSLIDMQQFAFDGMQLSLRVAYSEPENSKGMKVSVAVIASIAVIVSFFIVGFACFYRKWFAKGRGTKLKKLKMMLGDKEELYLYSYETMAIATDHFNFCNILGKGGFGPVYKGKLKNGREVAVKTLSNSSTQGSEEFMNEVVVISKLQHRNLVRLLGCCVEREEKMLVYEYMPNKSLDTYLFDSLEKDFLAWNRLQMIIDGITRGLIYLHRDSRLKIIHRDLKASNILLDEEFNPKISDFGLARIFGGKQDQENTGRVVGTFGYMAPEYAMRGEISEKSDVYSFGVLLLEILSGRRNSSFYGADNDLSLIGHAWRLWHENETEKFVNPSIISECNEMELSRYVHVGLLCVQEHAKDRPNMSAVLSMLNSEIAELPHPKLPAYTTRMPCSSETESSQLRLQSSNDLSITIIFGR